MKDNWCLDRIPDYYGYSVVVKDLLLVCALRGGTVGTYSLGNLFVVYEIRRHVFPTAPSPTTTLSLPVPPPGLTDTLDRLHHAASGG